MPHSSHAPYVPTHAQPGVLAALGRRTVLRGAIALLVVAAAATTLAIRSQNPSAQARPAPAHSSAKTLPDAASAPSSPSSTVAAVQPSAVLTDQEGGNEQLLAEVAPGSALAADGIPATALLAYRQAADRERVRAPGCGLSWPLLAAIGRVESDHGRFAGAVLHTDGLSSPPVIGIPLNGHGTALIRDTDGGRLDGDRTYDHAVGPMQFIPSTWARYGVDADLDGTANPFDIFDAAAAAADYLCAAGGDLTTLDGQRRAVLAYNHSDAYLETVLSLEAVYARGVPGLTVPVLPGDPGPIPPPTAPPVNPGRPPALHPTPGPSAAPSTSPSRTGPTSGSPTGSGTSACPADPSATSTSPATSPSTSGSSTASTSPAQSSSSAPSQSAAVSAPPAGCPSVSGPESPSGDPSASDPSASDPSANDPSANDRSASDRSASAAAADGPTGVAPSSPVTGGSTTGDAG
jgi:membrane-bound lytic murein transglycosylase B